MQIFSFKVYLKMSYNFWYFLVTTKQIYKIVEIFYIYILFYIFKTKRDTKKLKLFLRGHYPTGVTFLYEEWSHFYKNDNYYSGKRVIILRRK